MYSRTTFFIQTYRGHEVAPRPETLPREVTLAPQEVSSYRNCAFPLHEAHHTRHRKLRWNADAHVDVIAFKCPFQDATFLLLRQLVKNLSQMPPNRPVDFFRRYLGIKTTWYLQSYRVCDSFRSFSLSPPCLEVGAFQGGLCYYCLTRSNLCESPRQSRGFTCDNYDPGKCRAAPSARVASRNTGHESSPFLVEMFHGSGSFKQRSSSTYSFSRSRSSVHA